MPGGVTCPLDDARLDECDAAIDEYAAWYERSVLDCSCAEWLALSTAEDFEAWLEEHPDGALGVFARFGRSIGLTELGGGTPHLLSAGCYYDPERWQPPFAERPCLQPGGFYDGERGHAEPFRQELVAEHLRYAKLADPGAPRHPFDSETRPDDSGEEAYSYAKATRYDDHVVQLGPLADLVLGGDPLIASLFAAQGPTTWLRQFTRLHRPVATLEAMRETVRALRAHRDEPTFIRSDPRPDGDGFGAINAARGSLGHWVRIRDGKIANYQVITPTAWNGSPRDDAGRRGHWEESFVGLEIADLENPVELFHVVRSHDACLVCTVHLATAREFTFR
jgi:hydrogenase large subunit